MKYTTTHPFKPFLLVFGIVLISCKTSQCQSWTVSGDTVSSTGTVKAANLNIYGTCVKFTGLITDTATDLLGLSTAGKVSTLNGPTLSAVLYKTAPPLVSACDTANPLWYKQAPFGNSALVTRHCTWVGVGEAGINGLPNAPLSVSNNASLVQFSVVNPVKLTNRFTIDTGGVTYIAGKVGIGTTPSNYMLDVNGVERANEVKVCVFGYCDFVFDKNYKLMTLTDLQNYLNLNHHLPGIPSAEEMQNSDGVALGKMDSQLLQKVEELTLYVLQQQKEIEELKAEIKNKQ